MSKSSGKPGKIAVKLFLMNDVGLPVTKIEFQIIIAISFFNVLQRSILKSVPEVPYYNQQSMSSHETPF